MKVGDLVIYRSGHIRDMCLVEKVDGVMAFMINTKGLGTWTHVWNLEVISESR